MKVRLKKKIQEQIDTIAKEIAEQVADNPAAVIEIKNQAKYYAEWRADNTPYQRVPKVTKKDQITSVEQFIESEVMLTTNIERMIFDAVADKLYPLIFKK